MAGAYQELRHCLGLGAGEIRVADIFQQVVIVEEDVRQAVGSDVMPVFNEPREWRKGSLPDGSPVEFPARFLPQLQDDGSQVVFDTAGNAVLKMPKDGIYFEPVYSPLADATSLDDIEKYIDYVENYDMPC